MNLPGTQEYIFLERSVEPDELKTAIQNKKKKLLLTFYFKNCAAIQNFWDYFFLKIPQILQQ